MGNAPLRGHVHLVGITCEVRNESDDPIVLVQNPATVPLLRTDDVFKKSSTRFVLVANRCRKLNFNRLENEIRPIHLPVRMGIRYADYFAIVLEAENVPNVGSVADVDGLAAPYLRDLAHGLYGKHGQFGVVPR